jgi:hypothetical protein
MTAASERAAARPLHPRFIWRMLRLAMRFRYSLARPDGRTYARDVSADTEDDAALLCDEIWREAGLDLLSDDPVVEVWRLPDA